MNKIITGIAEWLMAMGLSLIVGGAALYMNYDISVAIIIAVITFTHLRVMYKLTDIEKKLHDQ